MSSILTKSTRPNALLWFVLALAMAVVLIPTWYRLAKEVWPLDEQAHGPIILIVSVFLIWQQRQALAKSFEGSIWIRHVGWALLLFSLLAYYIGVTQDIIFFTVAGQIALLGSFVMIFCGKPGVRQLWFPIVFLLFMLPLPGFIVDQATGSLKLVVSQAAASSMYLAGLPVARDGVLLQVGQYKLLVADACSGLYSLISLSALGILYLWLIRSENTLRNCIMFAAIFPIAIAANIIRVIILSLVTYFYGDAAGQGFLHGFAGMSLFLAALLLIIGLDGALRLVMPDVSPTKKVAR